jgi:hypothetical protein
MQTDLTNPVYKIKTRPQNSVYQLVKFVDSTNPSIQVDLSAFNMYCTFKTADFLTQISQNLYKNIKVQRIPRDPLGNPMQPLESGIYCLAENNNGPGGVGVVQGGIFELIINLFPSDIFPVGTYFIDWVIQRTRGTTKVLFTIEMEVTDTLTESTTTTNAPFITLPVSYVATPDIVLPIQIIQLPI